MKRHGNLWDKITNVDNLLLAHKRARRGKSFYSEVKMVDSDPKLYCQRIRDSLLNQTFSTSTYQVETRFDGRKIRTIHKLPYYPDRIVQHALLNVLSPLLVSGFIRDTFQSISGRGTSDAYHRVNQFVRSDLCPAYALKLDVEKYYPSVDNGILKDKIRTKLKCKNTLWLLDDIIDSTRGLPIGNYTSQHLGNLYLSSLDWYAKQTLKIRGYFRYCDDILIFAESPKELQYLQLKFVEYLTALKLKTKPQSILYNVKTCGVDFVGYVFKPNTTRVRKTTAQNFKACCQKRQSLSSYMSYRGILKLASCKSLWYKHISKAPKYAKKAI